MGASAPKILGPHDGHAGFLGSIGVRFMIDGQDADDRFSLVEHPMPAHALAAPMHRHLVRTSIPMFSKAALVRCLGTLWYLAI